MPTIKYRDDWKARPSKGSRNVSWGARDGIIVHHTAGPTNQSVAAVQRYHQDTNGWWDIGYNWLVDQQGVIWEGVGWTKQGAHTVGKNRSHLGFCWIGNSMDVAPSAAAISSLHWLVQRAEVLKNGSLSVTGHRDNWATACPGSKLYSRLNDIRNGPPGNGDGNMALTDADKHWIKTALRGAVVDAVRYTAHGDVDTPHNDRITHARRNTIQWAYEQLSEEIGSVGLVDVDALARAIINQWIARSE